MLQLILLRRAVAGAVEMEGTILVVVILCVVVAISCGSTLYSMGKYYLGIRGDHHDDEE